MARLVATSRAVGSTRSRKEKSELLAELIRDLESNEIEAGVAFLIGEPRQGKIGVGWATISATAASPVDEATLTIDEVDRQFDVLAAMSGAGSNEARISALTELLSRATADEDDFIRRLLIGGLRQGALAGLMADGVAKASGVPAKVIRRGAMLSGDLTSIARLAMDEGRDAVEAIGLEVMRPVLPMLASTSASAGEAIADLGAASVEWKLDGIRIQVHRDTSEGRDDVLIVSRNLNDVTGRLPGIVDAVRTFPAESFVLDGEAIGMSGDAPEAFQDTASRFGRHEVNEAFNFAMEARFFDILHRDGEDLIDLPLSDRLTHLEAVTGRHQIPGRVIDDAGEADRFFADAVEAGHEGVMVKAIDSIYDAGRRGKSWRKIKPVHTLDLVVLGAEWGSGRRKGWLSNLHLGARDPEAKPGEQFVMVGKTFKGLTDELLTWQTEAFLARKTDETHQVRHVVHIRPELVVEIALDGAQRSTRYPGGVALRFARVKRYRADKSPGDADTLDAVRALL